MMYTAKSIRELTENLTVTYDSFISQIEVIAPKKNNVRKVYIEVTFEKGGIYCYKINTSAIAKVLNYEKIGGIYNKVIRPLPFTKK